MRRRAERRSRGVWTLVVAGLGAAGLGGCASVPSAGEAPNAGLQSLGREGPDLRAAARLESGKPVSAAERRDLASEAALDLEAALAAASAKAGAAATEKPRERPASEGPKREPVTSAGAPKTAGGGAGPGADDAPTFGLSGERATLEEASAPAAPAGAAATASGSTGAGAGAREPGDPVAELASRMARLIREPGPGKLGDAAALAAIESLRPGAVAGLDSPDSSLAKSITGEDREVLLAARARVLANPGEASESLRQSLAKFGPGPGLKVARAALCSRVMGFGRYEAVAGEAFAAGRAVRAIVYCEVEGFVTRPARSGDPAARGAPLGEQVSVELTQSLTLYHDPSGLQAWHRPAQRVIETGRNARRDFYLIQQVELPATLTVGKYLLKVTVTDSVSGASDEATLPIDVVVR